jgi:hypothetical protein
MIRLEVVRPLEEILEITGAVVSGAVVVEKIWSPERAVFPAASILLTL